MDTSGSSIFFGSQYLRYQTATNDLIIENNFVDDNNFSKLIKNDYTATVGKGINTVLGVRGEWTQYRLNTTAGKGQNTTSSYMNISPNLMLSKTISDQLKIRVSYVSRITRPRYLFKIQVLAWYLGDRYYGLYYNKSRATITLGLEKTFLHNNLTVRFTANDIFHQTNNVGTYSVEQTDIYFDRTYSTNYFRLAATLRLGRFTKARFSNKATGESENSRAR